MLYLTPVNRNCEIFIGLTGWLSLPFRSNKITNAYSCVVREKDEFEYCLGLNPLDIQS